MTLTDSKTAVCDSESDLEHRWNFAMRMKRKTEQRWQRPVSKTFMRIERPIVPTPTYKPTVGALPMPRKRSKMDIVRIAKMIGYCRERTRDRNTTPRTLGFLNLLKRKYVRQLLKPRARYAEELAVLEGELRSRHDETHGPNGTVRMVMELVASLQEWEFLTEYGDYLGILHRHFRASTRNEKAPPLVGKQVTEIAKTLKEEEEAQKAWELSGGTKPNSEMQQTILTAAQELEIPAEEILYQINKYAERCANCHSDIKKFVDEGDFGAVAKKITEDRAKLSRVMPLHRKRQNKLARVVLKRFEETYFDWINPERPWAYELTPRALKIVRKNNPGKK